jgi:predicted acylesterase/phospholipase RssA
VPIVLRCCSALAFRDLQRRRRRVKDGALVDPVPAAVLREMGADLAVAVNVVAQLQRGVSTAISRGFRRVKQLNPSPAGRPSKRPSRQVHQGGQRLSPPGGTDAPPWLLLLA